MSLEKFYYDINDDKKFLITYFLLFFFGLFGIHRFYLRRPKSAFLMLFFTIVSFGTISGIWWILDFYFVYKYLREDKEMHISDTRFNELEKDVDYLKKEDEKEKNVNIKIENT